MRCVRLPASRHAAPAARPDRPAQSGGRANLPPPLPGALQTIRCGQRSDRAESKHLVATGPAQQLIHRHVERLARDIVQRHVDRSDRGGQHTTALVVSAAIQDLPDVLDPQRVHADQELAEVMQRPLLRVLARGTAGFAQSVDARVRLDFHNVQIARGCEQVALDIGDFHDDPPSTFEASFVLRHSFVIPSCGHSVISLTVSRSGSCPRRGHPATQRTRCGYAAAHRRRYRRSRARLLRPEALRRSPHCRQRSARR